MGSFSVSVLQTVIRDFSRLLVIEALAVSLETTATVTGLPLTLHRTPGTVSVTV